MCGEELFVLITLRGLPGLDVVGRASCYAIRLLLFGSVSSLLRHDVISWLLGCKNNPGYILSYLLTFTRFRSVFGRVACATVCVGGGGWRAGEGGVCAVNLFEYVYMSVCVRVCVHVFVSVCVCLVLQIDDKFVFTE